MGRATKMIIWLTVLFFILAGIIQMENDGGFGLIPANKVSLGVYNAQEFKQPPKEICKININTASAQELAFLPKIGEVLAERIIEYRKQNGEFTDISQIKDISGIGNGIYMNLKDIICVK